MSFFGDIYDGVLLVFTGKTPKGMIFRNKYDS